MSSREDVQKKTFVAWLNSQIDKRKKNETLGPPFPEDCAPVQELTSDLKDGVALLYVAEELKKVKCNQRLRPNARFKFHLLDNMKLVFDFLRTDLPLEIIGPEDIVDGNEKLCMGLVWMLISHYKIGKLTDKQSESKALKISKAKAVPIGSANQNTPNSSHPILQWMNMRLQPFGVHVSDFVNSLKNGKILCMLLESYKPGLFDLNKIDQQSGTENIQIALNFAEEYWQVSKLFGAEDMKYVDSKSMMTYLSELKMRLEENEQHNIGLDGQLESPSEEIEEHFSPIAVHVQPITSFDEDEEDEDNETETPQQNNDNTDEYKNQESTLKDPKKSEEHKKQFSYTWKFEDEWSGDSAGGQRDLPTWRNNPQFLLRPTSGRYDSLVLDISVTQKGEEREPMSFHVVRNSDDSDEEFVLPEHVNITAKTRQSEYILQPSISGKVVVGDEANGFPIFIVPSLWTHGTAAPFELEVSCSHNDGPVKLEKVTGPHDFPCRVDFDENWNHSNSGRLGSATASPEWRKRKIIYKINKNCNGPVKVYTSVSRTAWHIVTDGDFERIDNTEKSLYMGIHVLKNKDSRFQDILLPQHKIVHKTKSYTDKREIGVSLVIDDDTTYFFVPSTFDKTDCDLPFQVSFFTKEKDQLEIERYTGESEKYSIKTVTGKWDTQTSGGSFNNVSYWDNPCFKLEMSQESFLSVILEQLGEGDIKSIGLRVSKNKDPSVTDRLITTNCETVAKNVDEDEDGKKYSYLRAPEISIEITHTDVERPLFITPSTFKPGQCGNFRIMVVSSSAFSIEEIKKSELYSSSTKETQCVVHGEFSGSFAAGNYDLDDGASWTKNPQVKLVVSQPRTFVRGTLLLTGFNIGKDISPICLHLVQNLNSEDKLKAVYDHEVIKVFEDENGYNYVLSKEITLEVTIEDPGIYFLVPSLFDAGFESGFTLLIEADCAIKDQGPGIANVIRKIEI